ncbi:hypothetical protein RRG08_066666, partial [Elysia crispata]
LYFSQDSTIFGAGNLVLFELAEKVPYSLKAVKLTTVAPLCLTNLGTTWWSIDSYSDSYWR